MSRAKVGRATRSWFSLSSDLLLTVRGEPLTHRRSRNMFWPPSAPYNLQSSPDRPRVNPHYENHSKLTTPENV